MATYSIITKQAEDAIIYAIQNIPDAQDWTDSGMDSANVFGNIDSENLTSACASVEAYANAMVDAPNVNAGTYDCTITVRVHGQIDDQDRTQNDKVAGLMAAILFGSADQIVTMCNAAGLSDFTAQSWQPMAINPQRDGLLYFTEFTGRLICARS